MMKLWLWKNFVDGKPEYWAFDNAFPVHPNGDPMTIGSPCGYALVKESECRKHYTDEEIVEEIRQAKESR